MTARAVDGTLSALVDSERQDGAALWLELPGVAHGVIVIARRDRLESAAVALDIIRAIVEPLTAPRTDRAGGVIPMHLVGRERLEPYAVPFGQVILERPLTTRCERTDLHALALGVVGVIRCTTWSGSLALARVAIIAGDRLPPTCMPFGILVNAALPSNHVPLTRLLVVLAHLWPL